MSQVDAVRRRLVDPKAIDLLMLVPRWYSFGRDTIADALVICGGDTATADRLCALWRQDQALYEDAHRTPDESLLKFLHRHAPADPKPTGLSTKAERLAAQAKLGGMA